MQGGGPGEKVRRAQKSQENGNKRTSFFSTFREREVLWKKKMTKNEKKKKPPEPSEGPCPGRGNAGG